MRSSDGDTVIQRAFRVLTAFGPGRAELTLAELAHASGLARSTTYRLAVQLADQGALERCGSGWRLGVRMFELGQLVPSNERLRNLALAYMEDLYEITHETVHLAVLDGDEVLYVEMLSGHRKVRTPSRRGGRMPAHCTAVGKALMAYSDDALDSLSIASEPLLGRTSRSQTDPQLLLRELRDIRRAGIAFDHEEASEGLSCVAAPVIVAKDTAVAALSVSMPTGGTLTPADIAPAVRVASRRLSQRLRSQARQ